ncbi:hypothetical protein LCGC14_0355720 [marine sediment metagenome]|uniref:Uncharacterized protein n=1 Tax=marine sediment metagenome TaxID=412755 RepID=A0A0F9T9F4_9ZZZZ
MTDQEAIAEIEECTGLHVCIDPPPRMADLQDLLETVRRYA